MNFVSNKSAVFLQKYIQEIIIKNNYQDMIKSPFLYSWAMQNKSNEDIFLIQQLQNRQKQKNQLLSVGGVVLAIWAKGIFEDWDNDFSGAAQSRTIFFIALSCFIIYAIYHFVVNYCIKKPFGYTEIAYFLSSDYLIINELRNEKTIKTTFIKIADIAATKIENNTVAIYQDTLTPLLVYCQNTTEINEFIDKNISK